MSKEINELLGIEESADKVVSISASLIKNWWDYSAGKMCGIAFRDINVLKVVEDTPSDRMKLGQYFEFLCTGATNRDGSIPEAPLTSTGKPTAEGKRMEVQAENFKKHFEVEGIKILETGMVLQLDHPEMNYRVKGILDIFAEYKGEKVIVDIKSSGLIGNKWEEMGWEESSFATKRKLHLQVAMYKYLAFKQLGIKDIPFYFMIHSTSNDTDYLFWRADVSDFGKMVREIENLIDQVVFGINMSMRSGFNPYPSMKRCSKCPLSSNCIYARFTEQCTAITFDPVYAEVTK